MPFPKKYPFKIVEVGWVDSEHGAEWKELKDVLEEQEESLECRSCGYLVADKEDRIVLATSISAEADREETVSYYITIPKVSIMWQKELRRK